MSRSGYCDYGWEENPIAYLWGSILCRAIEGKRGQKLLRDLAAALDAMPVKELVSGSFIRTDGAVCTLGALGKARDLDMSELEKAARDEVDDEDGLVDVAGPAAETFDVARSMAQEIMYQNDKADIWNGGVDETSAERWTRMRRWVTSKLPLRTTIPRVSSEDAARLTVEELRKL